MSSETAQVKFSWLQYYLPDFKADSPEASKKDVKSFLESFIKRINTKHQNTSSVTYPSVYNEATKSMLDIANVIYEGLTGFEHARVPWFDNDTPLRYASDDNGLLRVDEKQLKQLGIRYLNKDELVKVQFQFLVDITHLWLIYRNTGHLVRANFAKGPNITKRLQATAMLYMRQLNENRSAKSDMELFHKLTIVYLQAALRDFDAKF